MKVLIVARGFPQRHNNMMGLFEYDQAVALARAGHDVAYAVADTRSIRRKRHLGLNQYAKEGVQVFEMNWPIGPMPTRLKDYARGKALLSLCEPIRKGFGVPDVIHAHFLSGGIASIGLSVELKRPLVITEHYSKLNNASIDGQTAKRAIKAYSACKQLICVSQALSESIAAQIGFESIVIPNVVNMPWMSIGKSERQEASVFHFVSAGNLIERKRFDLLIEAFAEISHDDEQVDLTIMGEGPERKKLQGLVSHLGIENHVKFFGRYERRDFARELASADAFALASRSETFGVVYAEALSMGIPVVATRCGGPEEFVNEHNGMLVPIDDSKQLAYAMKKMITDRNDYDSVTIAGQAMGMFSPAAIAERLTELYERIA